MKIEQLVHDVSVDLNDQARGYEYLHWTEDQLASYAIEALGWILDRDKLHLFTGQCRQKLTHTVVVKIEPGMGWTKACGCYKLIRVLGECDAHGHVIRRLRNLTDDDNLSWFGDQYAKCSRYYSSYRMDGAIVSDYDDDMLRVTPPVLHGMERFVLVECRRCPCDVTDLDDIPNVLVGMVKQWMLYRALAVENENNPVFVQMAEGHKTTFFTLYDKAVEHYEREYKRELDDERYRDLRAVQDRTVKQVPR